MAGRYPSSGCRRISANSSVVETLSSHPHRYGVAGKYETESYYVLGMYKMSLDY